MKKLMLVLLTLTTIGFVASSADAKPRRISRPAGDDVVIQNADQNVIQTGNGNTGVQTTIQQNRQSRRGGAGGDTGTVQDSRQTTDQFGNRNYSDQYVEQRNTQRRGNR